MGTAPGRGRTCPEIVARPRSSPRCGVRRNGTNVTPAVRPGTQLARLPGAVRPLSLPVRRSLWRRILLYIVVTQLLLVFLVLVVYLGRHAGT
ncbi:MULTISPECIES: hypothetical protein [unclassified Streptomyces]|uniref:hypothetical protein n=1 Tax=unclassified Streptomyces TaxID=2593676 RepID=UPI00380F0A66